MSRAVTSLHTAPLSAFHIVLAKTNVLDVATCEENIALLSACCYMAPAFLTTKSNLVPRCSIVKLDVSLILLFLYRFGLMSENQGIAH